MENRKNNPSIRAITRQNVLKLIKEVHNKHKTHGYRWINTFIRNKQEIVGYELSTGKDDARSYYDKLS